MDMDSHCMRACKDRSEQFFWHRRTEEHVPMKAVIDQTAVVGDGITALSGQSEAFCLNAGACKWASGSDNDFVASEIAARFPGVISFLSFHRVPSRSVKKIFEFIGKMPPLICFNGFSVSDAPVP